MKNSQEKIDKPLSIIRDFSIISLIIDKNR
jgi:hypothetical protein